MKYQNTFTTAIVGILTSAALIAVSQAALVQYDLYGQGRYQNVLANTGSNWDYHIQWVVDTDTAYTIPIKDRYRYEGAIVSGFLELKNIHAAEDHWDSFQFDIHRTTSTNNRVDVVDLAYFEPSPYRKSELRIYFVDGDQPFGIAGPLRLTFTDHLGLGAIPDFSLTHDLDQFGVEDEYRMEISISAGGGIRQIFADEKLVGDSMNGRRFTSTVIPEPSVSGLFAILAVFGSTRRKRRNS